MGYYVDLPQFVGSEKEQLAQLRIYLYRQAEALEHALNNIDKSLGGSYAAGNTLPARRELTKLLGDYVTEAGNMGGWHYKKWNKGGYEMHGSFEVTPTSSEQGDLLYVTNAIVIPVPFAISDDVVLTGAAGDGLWLTSCGYASAGAVSFKIMSDGAINTAHGITVRLCAVGSYPTNTEV